MLNVKPGSGKTGKGGGGIAKRVAILALLLLMVLGVVTPLLLALRSSGLEIESEGVYFLKNGKWERVSLGARPWLPEENYSYVIYFRNLNCPHCREFDRYWTEFLKKYSKEVNASIVVVSCTYFTIACEDETAAATFLAFYVTISPLIVVLHNGGVLYYGVPPFNATELYTLVTTLLQSPTEETHGTEG